MFRSEFEAAQVLHDRINDRYRDLMARVGAASLSLCFSDVPQDGGAPHLELSEPDGIALFWTDLGQAGYAQAPVVSDAARNVLSMSAGVDFIPIDLGVKPSPSNNQFCKVQGSDVI